MTSEKSLKTFYIATSVLYLIIVMHLPISIYTAAGHDDAWFIMHAIRIVNGEWLGQYNQMTLIKGVGYVYFLVINYILGIPATLFNGILYLTGAYLLVRSLMKIGLNKNIGSIIFLLLLMQPALYPVRVIRDDIYTALLMISVAGIIYGIKLNKQKDWIPISVFCGMACGLFWITREESVWIVPPFVIIIAYSIIEKFKNKIELKKYAKFIIAYMLFGSLPLVATLYFNNKYYGVDYIVEFKSSKFVDSYNQLLSVNPESDRQYNPISKAKRNELYRISPTFKELEPILENRANGWMDAECKFQPQYCGDYGPFFMWAYRDAVAGIGAYKNSGETSSFYQKISNEIKEACSKNIIRCQSPIIPMMPHITDLGKSSFFERIYDSIMLTTYQNESSVPLTAGPSMGPLDRFKLFYNFLGRPLTTEPVGQNRSLFNGWYYSNERDWINLFCDDKTENTIKIQRLESPDIAKHFNDTTGANNRFSLALNEFRSCSIVGDNGDSIKLSEIVNNQPKFRKFSRGVITIDNYINLENQKDTLALSLKKLFLYIFYLLCPILGLGAMYALLSVIYYGLKQNIAASHLLACSVFFWGLYFCRILLVVLVDITSFPAVDYMYLMPCFPLFVIGSFLSISLLFLKENKNDTHD